MAEAGYQSPADDMETDEAQLPPSIGSPADPVVIVDASMTTEERDHAADAPALEKPPPKNWCVICLNLSRFHAIGSRKKPQMCPIALPWRNVPGLPSSLAQACPVQAQAKCGRQTPQARARHTCSHHPNHDRADRCVLRQVRQAVQPRVSSQSESRCCHSSIRCWLDNLSACEQPDCWEQQGLPDAVHPTTAEPPVPFAPRPRLLDRQPPMVTSADHLKKGNGLMSTMTGRTLAMPPPMEAGWPRLTFFSFGDEKAGVSDSELLGGSQHVPRSAADPFSDSFAAFEQIASLACFKVWEHASLVCIRSRLLAAAGIHSVAAPSKAAKRRQWQNRLTAKKSC